MNSKEYLPGQGFDTTYGFMNGGIDYFKHTMSELDWHKWCSFKKEGYSTDLIANEAIKVIKIKKVTNLCFFILLSMLLIPLFRLRTRTSKTLSI